MTRLPDLLRRALIIGAALSLLPPAQAQNPFDAETTSRHAGHYADGKVELWVVKEGAGYTGFLTFEGEEFPVKAQAAGLALVGKFGASGDLPFAAQLFAEGIVFRPPLSEKDQNNEQVKKDYALKRQPDAPLADKWLATDLELSLKETSPSVFTGTLVRKGNSYSVKARSAGQVVRGTFTAGSGEFPFALRYQSAVKGATFISGGFSVDTASFALQEAKRREMAAAEEVKRREMAAQEEMKRKEMAAQEERRLGWANSLGMRFKPVPGTGLFFSIWETREVDYEAYASATPGVNTEWKQRPSGAAHPVVNVSWQDAKAFCVWLTEKERQAGILNASQSYRLPTDAEWSHAAGIGDREGGGTPSDKDMKVKGVYPWGTQWPPPRGAGNYGTELGVDAFDRTSPVGSFAPSRHGLYDLGGNVWEWCEDWCDSKQEDRVLRGASWVIDDDHNLWSSRRFNYTPDYSSSDNGFRVVLVGGSSR